MERVSFGVSGRTLVLVEGVFVWTVGVKISCREDCFPEVIVQSYSLAGIQQALGLARTLRVLYEYILYSKIGMRVFG